jgi:hypothetical protein
LLPLAAAVVVVVMVLRLEELTGNLAVLVEEEFQVQLQDKDLVVQEFLAKEIVVAIVHQLPQVLFPALAVEVLVRKE